MKFNLVEQLDFDSLQQPLVAQLVLDKINLNECSNEQILEHLLISAENDIFNLDESKKKRKKKRYKNILGWFMGFYRDPEQSMKIFNHNMEKNFPDLVPDSKAESSTEQVETDSATTVDNGNNSSGDTAAAVSAE